MATYTHGHHESVLRSHRWRTAENSAAYVLPPLTSGVSVLDVGCGPATITAGFAPLGTPPRPTGRVGAASEARGPPGTGRWRRASAHPAGATERGRRRTSCGGSRPAFRSATPGGARRPSRPTAPPWSRRPE